LENEERRTEIKLRTETRDELKNEGPSKEDGTKMRKLKKDSGKREKLGETKK
jgi:hypothetical protein